MVAYNVVNINGVPTPAEITFGNVQSGTGTIKTFTSNNAVIGSGTLFTTQLGNLFVLRDASNTYVGKITNIANNTYATMTTNASVAISAAAFNYQSCTITPITYDAHAGVGNISTFSSNNSMLGSGTTFLTQINVGYQIFDNTDGNLIGIVNNVLSNTSATLTTVSGYPASNIPFRFYDPVTPNQPNVVPQFNHRINNALLDWARSGLIQGLAQVKSYHPPMPDPVTGVLVNFPATIHQADKIGNIVTHKLEDSHVDMISNFQHDRENATVKLFDEDHGIVGSSTTKAIKSVPINKALSKMATMDAGDSTFSSAVSTVMSTIYGKPELPRPRGQVVASVPPGFKQITSTAVVGTPYIAYEGPGANVVYVLDSNVDVTHLNTSVDKMSMMINRLPPARITDDIQDARSYFSSTESTTKLTDVEKVDIAARASQQFTPAGRKMLAATGAPAVIPGQLNVVLHDEDPRNREYVPPKYYRPTVTNTTTTFNPDLPPSVVNVPPPEY